MLKAALYARVSSEEQAKRENSIPAQLRDRRCYLSVVCRLTQNHLLS